MKKLWRLFDAALAAPVEGEPSKDELKVLHQTIKKITDDIERFSLNTSVSTFMICTNQLSDLGCARLAVLEPIAILLAPFAPHMAEELWHRLGHESSVCQAEWPLCDERWLAEDTVKYPVQFNGKMRFTIDLPAESSPDEALAAIRATAEGKKWMGESEPKKVIFVPKKIINIIC